MRAVSVAWTRSEVWKTSKRQPQFISSFCSGCFWMKISSSLPHTTNPPTPRPTISVRVCRAKLLIGEVRSRQQLSSLEQKTSSDPDVTKEDSVPRFLTQGRPEGQPTQLEPSEGAIVRNVKGGKQAQTDAMRRKLKCFLGGMNNIWKKGGTWYLLKCWRDYRYYFFLYLIFFFWRTFPGMWHHLLPLFNREAFVSERSRSRKQD